MRIDTLKGTPTQVFKKPQQRLTKWGVFKKNKFRLTFTNYSFP